MASYTEVTAPTNDLISLSDLKLYLRVQDTSDEDPEILAMRDAAIRYAQQYQSRQFLTATYDLRLDEFPEVIEVRRPPVQSITSITYLDTNGDSQTLASSGYTVDIYGKEGLPRIKPAYNTSWPDTRTQDNAVTVRFVCGYGDAASSVPDTTIQAVKALVNNWFDNRAPVVTSGAVPKSVPLHVTALLDIERWTVIV